MVIRKVKNKKLWNIYSLDGRKLNKEPFRNKKDAIKRLREIEYFKYNKLKSYQKAKLKEHKKHHSKKHINIMIDEMLKGKSFRQAHNIATSKEENNNKNERRSKKVITINSIILCWFWFYFIITWNSVLFSIICRKFRL